MKFDNKEIIKELMNDIYIWTQDRFGTLIIKRKGEINIEIKKIDIEKRMIKNDEVYEMKIKKR